MTFHGVSVGALSALLCVFCMCSSSTSRPPDLGDCEAGCDPVTGSGSSTPPQGGGLDSGTGAPIGDASICGLADMHVQTSDALCAPCIVQNCCSQDTSCTDTCTSLLDCTQGCASGDTLCLGACENMWTAGLTAYQAFIQCVQASCTNTCPMLMQ
ncbi:MAG TPA: hypothetical protein VGM06_22475 [Polyangiaceae bacterium]|jgi:hypothetical protein